MSSPIEDVVIKCPQCDKQYKDWWRPSVNLDLDDFDDAYLAECCSAVCPHCQFKVSFGMLTVENGVFNAQ